MIGLAALVLLVSAGPQTVTPPPLPPPIPILEIAIHTVRADGSESGWATKSGVEPLDGYLSVPPTLCGVSSTAVEPVELIGIGWHVSGRILRQSGDQFDVQVEWSRAWEHGERIANGPHGVTQVSMRLGERVPLDAVAPAAGGTCGVVQARVDAAVVPRDAWLLSQGGGGGGRVSGTGRAGARASGGSGGAVTVADAAGLLAKAVASLASVPTVETELWLVHRKPDGVEEAERLVVHAVPQGTAFSFPSFSIQVLGGVVALDVKGQVVPVPASGKPAIWRISFVRRITGESPTRVDILGNGGSTFAMPNPNEVIEFQLPLAPSPGARVLDGHRFSIRLRVAPPG